MTKIRKAASLAKLAAMRQLRQCGDRVDGSIEYHLRPLRWTGILKSFGFQAARDDEVSDPSHQFYRGFRWFEWTEPGFGIELVLHMRVAVTRTAHEGGRTDDVPVRVLGQDLL